MTPAGGATLALYIPPGGCRVLGLAGGRKSKWHLARTQDSGGSRKRRTATWQSNTQFRAIRDDRRTDSGLRGRMAVPRVRRETASSLAGSRCCGGGASTVGISVSTAGCGCDASLVDRPGAGCGASLDCTCRTDVPANSPGVPRSSQPLSVDS